MINFQVYNKNFSETYLMCSKRTKGDFIMLKDFAWKAFENTGSIDSYIFFRELDGTGEAQQSKIAEDEAALSNLQ